MAENRYNEDVKLKIMAALNEEKKRLLSKNDDKGDEIASYNPLIKSTSTVGSNPNTETDLDIVKEASPEKQTTTTIDRKIRNRMGSIAFISQGHSFQPPATTKITYNVEVPNVKTDNIANDKEKTPNKHNIIKTCECCKFETHSKKDFDEHMRENHKFPCSKCVNIFGLQADLEEHENIHHMIVCNFCEEKFPDNTSCDDHMKEVHTFKCSICENIFRVKSEFDEHIHGQHMISCEVCG